MKKILFALLVMLFASKSFAQQMYVKNTTTCNVTVALFGHDNMGSDCSYESNTFTVAAGTAVLFTQLGDVNTWPGWMGGITSAATGKWDGIKFAFPTCSSEVGRVCGLPLTWHGICCSGSNVTATWIPGTGGDVEVTFNP